MMPRYWIRWMVEQGAPRWVMRWQARRGDPFGKLHTEPEARRDPYPLIEELRERGRLVRTPYAWIATDYELTRSMLRDNRFGVFVLDNVNTPAPLRAVVRRAALPANPVEPPSMLTIDPPDHTRIRKSVSAAFTPRAVGRLRDRVESVTAELIDALGANGSTDLVADFAAQVPIAIISEMLGFPDEMRAEFLEWGDRTTPMLDLGLTWRSWRVAAGAIAQMDHYLDGHIARLRQEPGEDILSSLVTAGHLDERELKATATLLMGAGFETTVNLIGNAVVQLLAHPEQLTRLRAEPDLWTGAVEEVLRFDPPVRTTARQALCDVELDGVRLRRGAVVVLSLAGANRDPRMFADPNRFDITRSNAREHLTFSSGIHTCLGAALARMEATHALRTLFEEFPELSLAGEPQLRELFTLHGYQRMPVTLGNRAHASVQR
ncbi:cytochrome P450 [Nocardia otitidiscaviarum]|uniref:Cytochrome P450 n=2 Tax=Nocardia otitidiscaviarum TaxID=1823 RepID=A0A516NGC4_9NOCA|nr:cytochrome P450 [Nocardia otitidiscaviarum]MCP9623325.1 cytochrome P450 [Nocardia otitidiscaviarum]QDP77953.1 cytochrome P450 [Nocardia otitidiscaviarum]